MKYIIKRIVRCLGMAKDLGHVFIYIHTQWLDKILLYRFASHWFLNSTHHLPPKVQQLILVGKLIFFFIKLTFLLQQL